MKDGKQNARRLLLVINPHSGTRDKEQVPLWLSQRCADRSCTLEVVHTHEPGDARRYAVEAVAGGFDTVIAAGGDGTVREVADGLAGTDTAMAIIPCGSGNGLARSLWIPQDFRKAADVAVDAPRITIDAGKVNGESFYCTFGMGFDAAVTEKYAAEKRRGKMTYVKNTLREFLSYSPQSYAMSVRGEVITFNALVIAVCNAPQYGNNAYIAPRASLHDGLLDVTIIHDGNLLNTAMAGIELLSGRLDKNMLVDTFRISGATITRLGDDVCQLDGEPMRLGKRLEVECRPGALKVIAPAEMPEFRPIVTPLRSMFGDLVTDVRHIFGDR